MMTTDELIAALVDMQASIEDNPRFVVEDDALPRFNVDRFEGLRQSLPEGHRVPDVYRAVNGFTLAYTADTPPGTVGAFKFMELEQMLGDWNGVIYFDDQDPADDPMRDFRPVDFPFGELCVGWYLNSHPTLYLYRFQGEPMRLDIDLEGYARLLLESRGVAYWQYALRAHLEGITGHPNVEAFRKTMVQLWPDFNFDDFLQLYDSLRLSRRK